MLVGGWTGEQYATAVLRFTLPDTADVVARLPEATRDPAVTVRGDTLYVAGGRTESGLSNAVYAVDLGAGTVSVVGRLPHAVSGGALVPAGGKLYLLGGKDAAGPVRTIVRIDPATGTIETAGTMPRPLAGAAGRSRHRRRARTCSAARAPTCGRPAERSRTCGRQHRSRP